MDSTTHNPNSTPRQEQYGDRLKNGKLLSESEKKAVLHMQKMWDAQDDYFDQRFAQWKVNVLRHVGYPNVALQRNDEKGWDYYLPPGTTPDMVPMISKMGDIIRKLTSVLLADPPAPEVEPFNYSDEEIEAAKIAERVLTEIDGEATLSEVTKIRRAFTKAADYGSGFIYYYVDPKGGGKVPISIEAHPAADHVDNALSHPLTGATLPPPYIKRYVRPDGTLTDRKGEAALRQLPRIKSRILTGRNVRFVPHNSEDLWDSDGVLIGEFMTWGRLKNLFQDKLGKLPEEEVEAILQYRPSRAEDIKAWDQNIEVGTQNKDERLVWVLTAYFRSTSDYPDGARVIMVGKRKVLHRGKWNHKKPDGTTEVLDIPLTQYAQWNEGRDDPYSVGTSELIGRAEEFRVAQIASMLDHLDHLNNRKIFLDIHSVVNEADLYRKDKKYIRYTGQAPVFEEVPSVPRDTHEVLRRNDEEMDNAIGIGETTSGLESPSVKSGRHALAIVQQAHASLSELKQNIERGYTRAGRIKLQLISKHFKTPRQAGWTTEDDEFRLDYWSNVDLGNARDVVIKSGTMTMLTPVAKAQLAEHYFTLGMLDQFKMYDIFSHSLGGTLGLEDDPTRLRVRRQISEWKNGPPEDWQPPEPQPQMDPMTGQPVIDPNTGQPVMMPSPDPILEAIWQPVPSDMLPDQALVRMNELTKMMNSKKYSQKPAAWRSRVEQEFQMMMQASMPPQPGPGGGGATPQQANQAGSPGQQVQAQDQAGLTDTENSLGQGNPAP